MTSFESEKRDFIRVKLSVPVKYRLISADFEDPGLEEIHEGTTTDLSGGGLLLKGEIPRLDWLALLLTGKMKVGVSLMLPTFERPVTALTRVAWIEGLDEETQQANLGLRFKEISQEGQDEILRYIIKTQMPG
ncbi:MAG: PilZ domain-containing protein [Planctomycetota bacterium]